MKPSMKYNILSLIKDKLDKHPKGDWIYTKPWYYDSIFDRIIANIGDSSKYIIFEGYGEYPKEALLNIIDEHNGNLLIGMHFDDYFDLVRQEEPKEKHG